MGVVAINFPERVWLNAAQLFDEGQQRWSGEHLQSLEPHDEKVLGKTMALLNASQAANIIVEDNDNMLTRLLSRMYKKTTIGTFRRMPCVERGGKAIYRSCSKIDAVPFRLIEFHVRPTTTP